jgi:hypothetical protein
MSWLRLDDGFAEHPKLLELPRELRWSWLEVLLYCARRRTDGVVTQAALERCGFEESDDSGALVNLGLLDELEDGSFRVHDWHDYNGAMTDAERQRRHREKVYGDKYHGVPAPKHGGKRGEYGSTTSSGHGDVTTNERDRSVTTHARYPHPHPQKEVILPTSTTDTREAPAGFEGLALDVELSTAKLLALLPTNLEQAKVEHVRGMAARLPQSVTASLVELVTRGHARDPVGYVISTLRQELEARGL